MTDYPEILADLAAKLEELLVEGGTGPEEARRIAARAAEAIGRDWAGQQIYVGKKLFLSRRDLAIWREFDGGNQADLARKHGMSTRQIYNILERARAADQRARQMGLFG